MKKKQKYTKRNTKSIGVRKHKIEKIILEELDKIEQEETEAIEQWDHTTEKGSANEEE